MQGVRSEPRRRSTRSSQKKRVKIWNKRVKAHADLSDLSLVEIARRAKIPERRLRRMMGGETHIRMGDAWAIALALGARVETLFHDPDQRRVA